MDFGFDSAYANCNAWDDDGNHSAITLYEQKELLNTKVFFVAVK